jgi:hypothetical protein
MKLLRTVSMTNFCWLHIFAEITVVGSELSQSAEGWMIQRGIYPIDKGRQFQHQEQQELE